MTLSKLKAKKHGWSSQSEFDRDVLAREQAAYNSPMKTSKIEQTRANIEAAKNPEVKKEIAKAAGGKLSRREEVANANTKNLSVTARLSGREQRIEKMLGDREGHAIGIKNCDFIIGEELYHIQQEGDFAEKTFELYIKNRWEKTRQWGYNLIDAYKVKDGLPENVNHGLQTERQARALKAAPKEEQTEILSEVMSEGEVTAVAIEKKIEQKKREPEQAEFETVIKDKLGNEVPKNLHSEWNRATELGKDYLQKVSIIRSAIKEDDEIFVEVRGARDTADSFYSQLKQIIPYAICPVCSGKKCKTCSNRGFVSKSFYDQSLPNKDK